MPRPVIGVTWTAEERAMMNLSPAGTHCAPLRRQHSHESAVTMPDGTSCKVAYRRFGACSHRFLFGDPLHEAVWYPEAFHNAVPEIEARAEEFAAKAFAQAMAEEQRIMRCKTVTKGSVLPPGEPQMKAKTAESFGGGYAVCIRFSNGQLSPVGCASAAVDLPVADLLGGKFAHVQLFGAQKLVIGILCRYLRRWVEPKFLPFPRDVAPALPETGDAEIG